MAAPTIRISDLDQEDRAELAELDTSGAVLFEDPEVDRFGHGELVTGAVLITVVAVSALITLASWLNKKRSSETFEAEVTVSDEHGRQERRVVRWTRTESEAAQPEQLAALADALRIDLSALASGS